MQWGGCEVVDNGKVCTGPVAATVYDRRKRNSTPFKVCAHHAAEYVTKDREGKQGRYEVIKHRPSTTVEETA